MLDSRQKGKSSLVNRVSHRLLEDGYRVAQIDLQRLGANIDAEQWYAGMCHQVAKHLGLVDLFSKFWSKERGAGVCAKWVQFLEEVALPSSTKPLIIVVDEIDFVLALPFNTDEFFAGIRGMANAKSTQPHLRKLAFALVGSSTPSQLIQDPLITPFNVGKAVELLDFSREELRAYEAWLPGGSLTMDRVFYWTGGHPYFTQLLCSMMPQTPAEVDALVATNLCSERAKRTEPNLLDSERRVLEAKLPEMDASSSRAAILTVYRDLLRGKSKLDDETNAIYSHLRLAGLAVHSGDRLIVRNRIYQTNFDAKWCAKHFPGSEARRVAAAARRSIFAATSIAAAILLVIGALAGFAIQQSLARGEALNVLKRKSDLYDKLAYNSGMLLISQDVSAGHWVGVQKMMSRLSDSSARGWECDYVSALIQPGVFVRKSTAPISSLRFFSDGRPFTMGEAWTQADRTVLPPGLFTLIPDYKANTLSDAVKAAQARLAGIAASPTTVYFNFTGDSITWTDDHRTFWKLGAKGSKQLLLTMPNGKQARLLVSWGNGSRVIAADMSSTLYCLDVQNGDIVWQQPISIMDRLTVSPDGAVVAGTERPGIVLIMKTSTGEIVRRLDGNGGPISSCEFSPDGNQIATSGEDGTVRTWDWQKGTETALIAGASSTYKDARWSGNHSLVTLDSAGNIRSVSLPAPVTNRIFKVSERGAIALAVSPDSTRMAVACLGGEFSIIDRHAWRIIGSAKLHPATVNHGLAFSTDGKLIFVADLGKVRIFLAESGREIGSLPGPNWEMRKFAVSADGKLLGGVGLLSEAWIWDIEGHKLKGVLRCGTGRSIAFSSDCTKVVTGSTDDLVTCWSLPNLTLLWSVKLQKREVLNCCFSKDSRAVFAATGTGDIAVLPADSGTPPRFLEPHYHRAYECVPSPDGAKVMEDGSDGVTRVLDVATGRELSTMRCEDYVSQAVWLDGNKRIVTACGDRLVQIWNAETGDELFRLEGHQGDVLCVTLADHGDTVVTSGLDGTVREWSRVDLSRLPPVSR